MRRTLLALLTLCAVGLVPASSASGAAVVGISDQQARTFENPLFKDLKVKNVRYIAPYDVLDDELQKGRFDAWIGGARMLKQRILVSFEHSRTKGREQVTPSVGAFTRQMKAFKKAYPDVKEINSWNEVNRCQVGARTEGQPRGVCKSPKRVAQYYMAARKVFKGAKIIGLNVLDENNPKGAVKFIKDFKRFAKPTPKIWGLHNYSDTNRFSTKRTAAILKAIGSRGELWLLETGGIVRLGTSFPTDEARAAKALGCTFTIARKFPRIKRLYIYQFNGTDGTAEFDAGLVDGTGNVKRPGFDVVAKRKARACKK